MSTLSLIRDKKRTAARQIERCEETLARLQAQLADFEAAERVLIAIGTGQQEEAVSNSETGADQDFVPAESRKPTGLRPVPEMIIDALEKGQAEGRRGLTPAELLSFIRDRYWPDAKSNDVGSTAWRMWKDGRLVKPDKNSPIYSLPGTKQNAA